VVTLASCESANQGTLIGAGSSLAQALHMAGIPLVVGSQFPLSMPASVLLTKHLYRELLMGADPRQALVQAIFKLRIEIKHTHDWASIVTYAALPADIEKQLPPVLVRRVVETLNVTEKMTEVILDDLGKDRVKALDLVATYEDRVKEAGKRLKTLKPASPTEIREQKGVLASAAKRMGNLYHRLFQAGEKGYDTKAAKKFAEALELYREAHKADPASSWALLQVTVLDSMSSKKVDPKKWVAALYLAQQECDAFGDKDEAKGWALGTLMELYLLGSSFGESIGDLVPSGPKCVEEARKTAVLLKETKLMHPIQTNIRQLSSYAEVIVPRGNFSGKMAELAKELRKTLEGPATATD
jgi:hypothetical protein